MEQPGQAGEVHISALTHFEIVIDGKSQPVVALADPGLQIPVIRRETIAQGIFGDLMIADLVTLQIKGNQGCESNDMSHSVSLQFQ